MAHVIADYTFRAQGERLKSYNLDQYLDGQIWSVEPGVDTGTLKPQSVRASLLQLAKRRGCKVRTNVVEGRVIVQKIG